MSREVWYREARGALISWLSLEESNKQTAIDIIQKLNDDEINVFYSALADSVARGLIVLTENE